MEEQHGALLSRGASPREHTLSGPRGRQGGPGLLRSALTRRGAALRDEDQGHSTSGQLHALQGLKAEVTG